VVVSVQVQRLLCPARGCARQTFREQVPGLLERYQRRTSRLTGQLGAVVKELAGRAGARLSAFLSVKVSRSTALRLLMRLPLPPLRVPRVLGVDDFALKRRHRYATVLIDAETGERIDVLPGRGADALETWLRSHPGVEIICRDGSGAYGEAMRRALPDAVQVGDRWHLWANLCDKTLAEVRSHSACWATVNPPRPAGVREQTSRERWRQIHDLLNKGVGLLECARRLNLSLNTIKGYARTREPEAPRRAPHARRPLPRSPMRTARDRPGRCGPAVVPRDQRARYTGSLNLLYRYITQGRAEGEQPVTTPRHLARLLLTHPTDYAKATPSCCRNSRSPAPATTPSSPPGSPPSEPVPLHNSSRGA
jgi:hypothetical protein